MAFKGSLLDISLVDLLQVFGMSAKTGKLMLERPGMQGGVLWVSKGAVANAATMDLNTLSPVLAGESAVIEMLQWENASFRFIAASPGETYQRVITQSNEWLILEGLRRRDEQSRPRIYSQISMDSRLRTIVEARGATTTLQWNHEEMLVLTLGAKVQTIGDLVKATGYPESEIFGVIGRLMALRLIELEPEDQPGEQATAQSYDDEQSLEAITPFLASQYS